MNVGPNHRSTLALGLLIGAATCTPGCTSAREGAFAHPGAFDSAAEFGAISAAVAQGRSPWADDFELLRKNSHDDPNRVASPVSQLVRGKGPGVPPENYSRIYNDAAATYALALDWRISGDVGRADRAVANLMAWARNLTSITGDSDRYLASGLYGYQLAVAGETLRGYPGWRDDDRAVFANMLLRVFYPMNRDFLLNHNGAKIDHYWANWDLSNIASMIAIGVFTDRPDVYEEAKSYYLHGAGNGSIEHAAWTVVAPGLAQWQESGRDQGHTLLGIGLAGTICEIASHQGDDLFGYDHDRLLDAARYVARYNLGETVPFVTYANSDVTQAVISPDSRGLVRPIWALYFGHYVQQGHRPALAISQIMTKDGIEGGGGDYGATSGGFDQLGYGTLTFLRP